MVSRRRQLNLFQLTLELCLLWGIFSECDFFGKYYLNNVIFVKLFPLNGAKIIELIRYLVHIKFENMKNNLNSDNHQTMR